MPTDTSPKTLAEAADAMLETARALRDLGRQSEAESVHELAKILAEAQQALQDAVHNALAALEDASPLEEAATRDPHFWGE